MFKALSRPLPDLKDWRFSVDQWGIAWAEFDREGESQNSLGRRPLEELARDRRQGRGGRARQVHPRPRHHLRQGARLHRRRRHPRVRRFQDRSRRDREAAAGDGAVRPHRAAAGAGRLRHPRLLPRRRARAGARLPLPHRDARRRHQARLPRSEARHLPRLQRHGALDPPGRRPGRHAGDADRQDAVGLGARAAWASSTSWSPAAARCAGRRARPCCASASRSRPASPSGCCRMWPARDLLAKRMRAGDEQEGARGSLSGALSASSTCSSATAATTRR